MFGGLFFAIILIITLNMRLIFRNFFLKIIIIFFVITNTYSLADNHNIYEVIEQIQKDIVTLEKAVYSSAVALSENNQENKKKFSLRLSSPSSVLAEIAITGILISTAWSSSAKFP